MMNIDILEFRKRVGVILKNNGIDPLSGSGSILVGEICHEAIAYATDYADDLMKRCAG